MEALEIGLLHRAFVSQSKALLFFLPLLLLMMAFLHSETLMPTIWHAFTGFFEGPAFAFLVLNCLIVTIIASTKLESEKGGHEEEIKTESMREMEKGYIVKGAFIGENVIRRGIIGKSHSSSKTNGYDYHMNEGKDFVGSSCSLNANYKDQILKQEPINVSEKKPIMRAYRLPCPGTEKVGLLPSKPLRGLKEKKPMKGSFFFNDNKGLGRAGDIIDHQSRKAEEPDAAAKTHPSLEEVWAAIMLAKKSDHRIANYKQAGADQCIKGSNYVNDNQALAAAACTPPAAATEALSSPAAPPAAAAAAANPVREASEASKPPKAPSDAHADAIEGHEDAGDYEHDSELEELNRRAEEFIARFNKQMRLQHQEWLQRKGRRRPSCNHHIQYSNHLQLPAPGLLVG